jgi:hypothetical protein
VTGDAETLVRKDEETGKKRLGREAKEDRERDEGERSGDRREAVGGPEGQGDFHHRGEGEPQKVACADALEKLEESVPWVAAQLWIRPLGRATLGGAGSTERASHA